MHFETLCLHAGYTPEPSTLARAVPIYRSAAYQFKSTEHAANLFALKEPGNIYSRLTNPTQQVLEERLAQLEGGAGAVAVSSGTSAIFYAILNLCQAGDEVVSARNIYGGTYTMFKDIFKQFNIKTRFVDGRNPEEFERAISVRTKAIFVETIGNPTLDVADLRAIADIAHAHGLPLVVDSTFTPPSLLRPFEHGADVVVHSLTKWIGGHGSSLGGVVIESGRFDYGNGKFPLLSEPEASYHDLRFSSDLGGLPPFTTRIRLVQLRNLGACISPDNSWQIVQGIETLSLRMERHSHNALTVARFLESHPRVAWVRHPALERDPSHTLARKYLSNGAGGMVVVGLKGGRLESARLVNNLRLFSHVANVGDARSLVIHPASTTHSQLTEEQLRESGVAPELVRLSIGIEHIEDILADLSQALER